jgi:DNA-binding transcriptional LysR family regulator
MDLKHLRTFSTVAELGSVSKAALRLRVAQPALSRQIMDLEKELGLKLFDRIGRRLLLTRAGEGLVEHCRGVLGQVRGITEQARMLQGGQAGSLKIGASPQVMESVIPATMSSYVKTFPLVEVKLVEVVGRDQLIMVQRGDIDIGIGLLGQVAAEERFATHPLGTAEILAACHPSHELAKGKTVEIATLGRYPLLLLDSSYAFRRLFDASFRLAGLEPNVIVESRAPHTLVALAEAGHGVAIIQTITPTSRYKVRVLRVAQKRKPMRLPMVAIWDRRRPLPRYAEEFCKLLSEQLRKIIARSK